MHAQQIMQELLRRRMSIHSRRSRQLLRAALMVQGRASTFYEDVHPVARATSLKVYRAFMKRLKEVLPLDCRPIFVTDAGFRSTWFKMLDSMGYAWTGRIRNRDMVRPSAGDHVWHGCKTLYGKARSEPQDLGRFDYVRSHPMACRLVLVKKNRGADTITKLPATSAIAFLLIVPLKASTPAATPPWRPCPFYQSTEQNS